MSDICSKCGFDMDAQFEVRTRLIDKLDAYQKQLIDMDYTIGHLRQENAELKQNTALLNSKTCELESGWKADVASLQITLAHLRQENAELKAESLGWRKLAGENGTIADNRIRDLQLHKAALEKCKEALAMAYEHVAGKADWFDFSLMEKALGCIKELPNPQPTQDSSTHRIIRACLPYLRNDNTRQLYFDACKVLGIEPEVWDAKPAQDPATAIAYGLYPGSARPVNPKT